MTSLIFSPNVGKIDGYSSFVNSQSKYVCAYAPLSSSISYDNTTVSGNNKENKSYLFTANYRPTSFIESFDTANSYLAFYNPFAANGLFTIPVRIAPSYHSPRGELMQGLSQDKNIEENAITKFDTPVMTNNTKDNVAFLLLQDLSFDNPSTTTLVPVSKNNDVLVFIYRDFNEGSQEIYNILIVYGVVTVVTQDYKVTSIINRSNKNVEVTILDKKEEIKAGSTVSSSISLNSQVDNSISIVCGSLTYKGFVYNGNCYFAFNDTTIQPVIPEGTLTFTFTGQTLTGITNGCNMSFILFQDGKSITINSTPNGFLDVSSLNIQLGTQVAFIYGEIKTFVTLTTTSLTWQPSGSLE